MEFAHDPTRPEAPPRSSAGARALGLLVLLAIAALSSAARISTALGDPNFDTRSAEGLLKSDPGLLYSLTRRVVEAGGALPADFRADRRIEHPGTIDVLEQFTVGQEFLVAWCHRLVGGEVPLHVLCVWVMGIVASLAVLGVYGLTLELSGRVGWALGAAGLWALLPASYRTIGFVLVREDLSLPLFSLQLWLLARAARLRTAVAFAWAGLALGAAAATWHATGFLLALELACLAGWYLHTGGNPLALRRSWVGLAAALAMALAVPVLRAKMFALSPPLQIGGALLLCTLLRGAPASRRLARAACLASAWAALAAISYGCSRALGGGILDYSHVFELLVAKLRHLGQLPSDPTSLSFDVRLMWQGPFETLALGKGAAQLSVGLLGAAVALPTPWRWLRARAPASAPGGETLVGILTLVSLPVAWLIQRTVVLPGLLLPVILALGLRRVLGERRGAAALAVALIAQALLFGGFLRGHSISWYQPPERQLMIADALRAVRRYVPEGEPIVCDFMSSGAVLAHTDHPVCLQPKYESGESRRRAEEFFDAFYRRPPEALRALVRDRFQARYLLIDHFTLWRLGVSRTVAGLGPGARAPLPGTAASAFLSDEEEVLRGVPGFELLYYSPDPHRTPGEPGGFYRLFRVED